MKIEQLSNKELNTMASEIIGRVIKPCNVSLDCKELLHVIHADTSVKLLPRDNVNGYNYSINGVKHHTSEKGFLRAITIIYISVNNKKD